MPDIYFDVDAALSEVPVNIFPLTDDTDFKTIEGAVAYNAAGMTLRWHFVTSAGAYTVTSVTPTTGGTYDWTDQGDSGIYTIEIPASAGASINNDTEGYGWFTGVATGVLPWRSPIYGFRAAAINDSLCDTNTTGILAPTTAGRTLDVSAGGEAGVDWANVGTPGSTVGLSATTVATVTTATTATNVTTVNGLAANVITATSIQADAITAAKIATGAIDADAIADNAIDAGAIASGAITSAKFAAGAITATVIATDAIDADAIAADAVTEIQSGLATAAALTTVDDFLDTEIAAIKTVTDAIGATGTGLSAIPWNASWDAEVQSECTDALNAYDPPTKAELDTAVADVSVAEIQASALADLFNTDSGTTYGSAVAGSVVKEIADNAGGSALTEAGIADAVWDEVLAGHAGAGSAGEALSAAGTAGDPWTTALPGAYGSGTAGKIIGDNINATISSRATQTSVDDLPTNAEFATSQAAADDDTLTAISGLDAKLDTIDNFLDTEVAAIKAKTDSLTFTVAGQVDSNIQSVNDVTVNGNGSPGQEWGP